MNIQRIYKKYNIDEIKQNSFILWRSLISLNQSLTLWIPYQVGPLFFHIIPKKNTVINTLIKYYNKKNLSLRDTIIQLSNIWEVILDIEYNYYLLFMNKDEDFREYIHPIKQKKELQDELYKIINLITKKIGRNDVFSLVFTKKVEWLRQSYIWKYNIYSEVELQEKVNWKSYKISKNRRDRNKLRVNLFDSILKQLKTIKRYIRLVTELGKDIVDSRLNYEISVIKWNNYVEYFLNYLIITQFLKQKKIIFFLKGSAVWSLLLYLLGISNINPITHWISFERFLSKWKIADIDIDIPSSKREEIILWLNKYFKTIWYEVILILNRSSSNNDKYIEHPSGILIEETEYIDNEIPLQVEKRGNLTLRTSQLYDSSTTPVLEELGYLKYDLLRSQVLEELQIEINSLWLDFYDLLWTWETLWWEEDYISYILNWEFFQINSFSAKELVKKVNPQSYFDLVKIIACNRPALMRLYNINILAANLKSNKWISLKDKEIERIISSSKSWKIMLFQDQVLELLLLVLPDVDYSSVIKLIKARWEILWQYKEIFLKKCEERIWDKKYTKELWMQIENFDQYGLNKAHSSSYALITYLQLYIEKQKNNRNKISLWI